MNNERYNQLIDEAYENYTAYMNNDLSETRWHKTWISDDGKSMNGRQYTKEEFIDKCKTDSEFSKKWGLKIEERDLSFKERRDLAHEYAVSHNKLPLCIDAYGHKGIPKYHEVINKTGWNIPTKLITVTYKDEKIEVYE